MKNAKYNELIDEWSLGSLLYNLITGQRPFDGKREEIISKTLNPKKQPKYN